MDLGLRDKVAIITGSSRGLGLASAKALAAEGCFVTISGRTHATLHAAAREVAKSARADDRVLGVEADLAQADGVKRVIDRTVDRFGGIDILVNSLGVARGAGLLETADEEWQEAVDHTVMPAVRASRLAVPHMTRRGGGSIIIIASIFGREAGGRMTYNAVKAAEISLAKSLAQQLAPANIRVNSVSPGSFLFEGGSWWKRQQENPAAIADYVKRELPFGRFGKPDELGDVIAFLASSRASWISGTSIVVDGCQSRAF
jgi:3-oxoacyl-[acyl-carrier protein] reductase